jgi:hypothetical protein
VFCSFLALMLRKELMDRLAAAGHDFEGAEVVFDLERLVETAIEPDGKRFLVRPAAPGCSAAVFKALGIALPAMVRSGQPPASGPTRATTSAPRQTSKTWCQPQTLAR